MKRILFALVMVSLAPFTSFAAVKEWKILEPREAAPAYGHAAEEFVETPAGDYSELLARKMSAGGRFVEASCDALDGDSFHGFVN